MNLAPCPFCGSTSVKAAHGVVRCGRCGANGPFGDSNDAAISYWNRRVEPALVRGDTPSPGTERQFSQPDLPAALADEPPVDPGL